MDVETIIYTVKTSKGPWVASRPPQASLQLLAPLVQSSTNRQSVFGCRLLNCENIPYQNIQDFPTAYCISAIPPLIHTSLATAFHAGAPSISFGYVVKAAIQIHLQLSLLSFHECMSPFGFEEVQKYVHRNTARVCHTLLGQYQRHWRPLV